MKSGSNRSACVRLPEHLTTSNLGNARAFDTVKSFLFGSVEFGTISASTGSLQPVFSFGKRSKGIFQHPIFVAVVPEIGPQTVLGMDATS